MTSLEVIGNKIIKAFYSTRVISTEKKRIYLPPHSPSFKVAVFVALTIGSLNSSATLHGGDGGGKALFPV